MSGGEAWRAFSTQLDDALALAPEARGAWLDELMRTEPENARRIRALLDSAPALEAAGFLEDAALGAELLVSLVGARVGPWRIEAELGRGGMSSVWRAHREDGRAQTQAALKFISLAALGREGETRFRREGSLLGRLDHPNIARLLDAGVYGPTRQPYLVLEYVDGLPIDEHCEAQQLGLRQRLGSFRSVLGAVAHAHGHLIVHRDLKPSNILVTRAGEVKLLDFGIAKLLESDETLTRTGFAALTPQYAAPEQLSGGAITTRTDVFALGLLLYRLLTGRDAFPQARGSLADLPQRRLDAAPVPPSQVRPGVPALLGQLRGDLDNIVGKALRLAPDERYPTAAALDEDLARFLRHEPVSARPATLSYRASKFLRRNRGVIAVSALAVAGLLATTAFAVWEAREAQRQRDLAAREAERAQAQAAFADQLLMQIADAGERLTPELLIARSVEFVEKRFGDEPEFAVGLLIHLSGRYMNRGETAKELETLVKAERLAVRAGSLLLLARVECNTVETELAAGRRSEAHRRLERGLASLARSAEPSVPVRFECANAQAILRDAMGDPRGAIAAASRGAQLLEESGETASLNYQTATSMLTMLHRTQLELAQAMAWNRRGLDALERAGFGRSENAVSALHGRSQVLAASGQWAAALALERDVLARVRAHDPSGGAHPSLLAAYARALSETGDEEGALRAFAAAARRARETSSHAALTEIQLAEAELRTARGELPAARALLAEAAERIPRDAPAATRLATALRVARARLALAAGYPDAAARELAPALADIGDPTRERRASTAPALRLASALALARRDLAEAQARARQALEFSRGVALEPERSADVGEAWLALARAQRAAGESAEARGSAARAAAALRAGRGERHPSTQLAELWSRG